jgi:Glycosyltransferase family 87
MRQRLSSLAFAGAAAVIVFQITCPIAIAAQGSQLEVGQFSTQSDAARYRSVAEAPGTPYRDFDVEYPPLAVGLFKSLGAHDFGDFRQRLLALEVLCQGLIVFLLFRVWGKRAGWSYLALSTPMLFVVYTGFDLVGVAVAVTAAALVHSRRPIAGAVGFVVGAFTKLWPIVLLPSLLVRRQTRAFIVGAGLGIVGLISWTVWGGAGAIGQVLTYRGARGWEYESIPGSLLRLATRDPLRFESGSWRVGVPPRAFGWMISAVLILAIAGVWWLAFQRPTLPDGIAETAAVTALLVLGTLLSPQFVIWPLPFVAIAAAAGTQKLERWAGAAAVLTLMDWIWFDPHHPALFRSEVVILARNAALVGLLVAAILAMRCSPTHRVGLRRSGNDPGGRT